ncbi:MAG: hypothetical protein ACOX1Y_06665 [Zhaonellaceae bacterium]|jgi:hypothetical protein|nr:hypothetical protein [Clostridia bacterium]
MEKFERAIKRLELVREGLHDNTIDVKDVLDIVLEHLIDLCQELIQNT